jgi:RNA polymerase sigma-70 factor (ECF subfamily)
MQRVSQDRAGFEALFLAHYDAVSRYALRRVGPALAEDVVAETFAIVWRKKQTVEGDPLPWLFGIARRVAANHLRSAKRRTALNTRLRQQPSGENVDPAAGGQAPLLDALRRLSIRDQEVLLLVAWEQLDRRSAARALGCSTATLAVRLHRARHRLAEALEADSLRPRRNERTLAHDPSR